MEFRQLRYFVAVAEEGNIGNAALRLHVSQPPISRQIRALEQELSVLLFRRTPKGVELTAAGALFLEDARKILDRTRRAAERTRAADKGEIGGLDVGFFGSPIFEVLPRILRAFLADVPDATVTLTRLDKMQQVRALREREIHVGFGRYFPVEPDLVIEKIADEPLFLAVPTTDHAIKDGPAQLNAIISRPTILFPKAPRPSFADEVIGLFKRQGFELQVAHLAEDVTATLAHIAIGEGWSVVPESVAAIRWPAVRFVPLEFAGMTSPVNCIYRREGGDPILGAFLSSLRRNS